MIWRRRQREGFVRDRSGAPRGSDGRARVRAVLEVGPAVEDPSEDLLLLMVEDVIGGHEGFVIVESMEVNDSHTYIQAAPDGEGGFVVEYRAGSPQQHHSTRVADHRAAHALLFGWVVGATGWDDGLDWRHEAF